MEHFELETPKVSIKPLPDNKKAADSCANNSILVHLTGNFARMSGVCAMLPNTVHGDVQLLNNDDGTGSLILQADSVSQFNHRYRDWLSFIGLNTFYEMNLESCRILAEAKFNGALEWLVNMIYNYNFMYGTSGVELQGKDIKLSFGMLENPEQQEQHEPKLSYASGCTSLSGYTALLIENEHNFFNTASPDEKGGPGCSLGSPEILWNKADLPGIIGMFENPGAEGIYSPNDNSGSFAGFYDRIQLK